MKNAVLIFAILFLPHLTHAVEAADKNGKTKDLSALIVKEDDFTMGSKSAKVTMIEYSALSCPHCKDFHASTFSKLKANYIDTGKLLYVYRSLPTNRSALAGAKLTLCVAKEDFFKMLTTLFEAQTWWAYDENYMTSLENLAKLGGIPQEKFRACQNDKQIEERILGVAVTASKKLGTNATPTFYINGEEISGDRPFAYFQTIIDKKLEEAK
jgi:protein-disulfide isomerase